MARYALVIGIGKNILPLQSLSKTVGDAKAVADVLEQSGNFISVERLIGEVNQRQLEDAFQRLLQKQAAKNEAVIYYTGHGFPLINSSGVEQIYLAPSDCQVKVKNGQVLQQEKGILLGNINSLIGDATLSSLVVLLECCYSGALLVNKQLRKTMTAFTSTDYFLIAACREFETAYALKNAQHSIFTTALLKALHLEKNDRAEVTTWRLFDAIYKDLRGSGQEPLCMGSGRSITFLTPISQVVNENCPYQGLSAFVPETEQFFFGRNTEIADLIAKLQITSFVPVIGASGSGKSSVVLAGLIPRLQRQGWHVLEPMKPGDNPVVKLKEIFASLFTAQDYDSVFDLIDNNRGLTPVIEKLDIEKKVLLFVDQFEEIFTVCTNQQKRNNFIQLLTANNSPNFAVVIALRADFVDPCLTYGGLTQAIQHHALFLGALEGEDLEAAIMQPAARQGYRLQGRLLQAVLEDVEAEQNCLPLLQFVLQELWNGRNTQTRELTLEQYREIGRIRGALDSHAERTYVSLAANQQGDWVRRVMLKLVRIGNGNSTRDTRQRCSKSELLEMATGTESRQAIKFVISSLVNARLLVSNPTTISNTRNHNDEQDEIDLIHEALMQGWRRFAEWREHNRARQHLTQQLEDARREWKKQKEKKHQEAKQYLLEGRLLQDAKQLLKTHQNEFSAPLQIFVRRSLKQQRRKQIQLASWLILPSSVFLIVVESFLREDAVKKDYERLSDEDVQQAVVTKRASVTNLAGGCFAGRQYSWLPGYLRERVFGNCRPLLSVNLLRSDLSGINLSGSVLNGANLSGANLRGSNLSGASLIGANLSGAILQGANLSGANLVSIPDLDKPPDKPYDTRLLNELKLKVETNLSSADLSGANLSNALLNFTNLSSANLRSANLSRAFLLVSNLRGANLKSANLSDAVLFGAKLLSTDLSDADLRNAQLHVTDLGDAELSRANLSSVNLSRANLSRANLNNTNLSNTNLSSVNLSNANLSNANLSNANLSKGDGLINANLSNANLSNANLSNANLSNANLSNANLSNTNLSNASLISADLSYVKFGCSKITSGLVPGKTPSTVPGKILSLTPDIPGGILSKDLCTNLKDIKWETSSGWQSVQNRDQAINVPPALTQQLEANRNRSIFDSLVPILPAPVKTR